MVIKLEHNLPIFREIKPKVDRAIINPWEIPDGSRDLIIAQTEN